MHAYLIVVIFSLTTKISLGAEETNIPAQEVSEAMLKNYRNQNKEGFSRFKPPALKNMKVSIKNKDHSPPNLREKSLSGSPEEEIQTP